MSAREFATNALTAMFLRLRYGAFKFNSTLAGAHHFTDRTFPTLRRLQFDVGHYASFVTLHTGARPVTFAQGLGAHE